MLLHVSRLAGQLRARDTRTRAGAEFGSAVMWLLMPVLLQHCCDGGFWCCPPSVKHVLHASILLSPTPLVAPPPPPLPRACEQLK